MDKILNNLGLCQKANGLISGEEMVIEGIQSGKVYYVFLASDAGYNTTKQVLDKAKYYEILVDNTYTSAELSHSIGKQNRKVIGITNKGFLKILKR